jgi:hypothetical protein
LATKGLIHVRQDVAYGPITLRLRAQALWDISRPEGHI